MKTPPRTTHAPHNTTPPNKRKKVGSSQNTQPHRLNTPRTPHHNDECRRRPTLPHPPRCSTIGAGRLSFRVRKGTGRDPAAKTTDKTHETTHTRNPRPQQSGPGMPCHSRHCTVDAKTLNTHGVSTQQVNHTNTTPPKGGCQNVRARPISTGHLQHSHAVQIRPINPVVYREPQTKPHLETGFPLRCFQRLSLPYVANQPCHGRDNWPTRGMSNPVLSY